MKIHPFTFLYLFLAYWGHSSYYVAFLLFSILHEIGHYCMALFYRFEIESVVILPFGAFLSLKDLGKHYVYEEIGMLLCGPFINLICFIFFFL
ncbi:MAG: site-2 protease family protein [Faecalibacillus faecis]